MINIIPRFIFILRGGSSGYWKNRYRKGGNSGNGSYGKLAQFKAEIINDFVEKNNIVNAIEFGCGDGNQLELLSIQNYIGFDVSQTAIKECKRKFRGDSTKEFYPLSAYNEQKAELTLSIDVIYHLVEDSVFQNHMRILLASSLRWIIIYSTNFPGDRQNGIHVLHRRFTDWTEKQKGLKLIDHIPNQYPKDSLAEFFIFEKMRRT